MTIPTAPRPSIRRALRPTLLLLPAFFVSILYLNSCSSAPTAEELMQQEMAQASAALGVAISSMDALESGVKTIEKRNIAGHSGLKPSDLWQVQYFRASLRGDAGELVPSKIVRMPLRKPLAGSDLYLCFDSQDALIHLGLSGDQAESEMETLWKGVLSQFEGYRAASTADLLTPSQAHRHWKEVTASTRSRGGSEELYAQKRFMALSRARLGQVFALTGRGEVPSAALLQDWRNQWSGLRTLSVDLGSVIGSSTAAEYDDIVTDAEELLDRAIVAAKAGNAAEVRKLAGGEMSKSACRSCHTMNSPALGGKLRPTLENRLSDFGVVPLFRVDADLWSPSSREQEVQYLAYTVKAGLLLAGAL
jgi:hypothetical protein